MKFAKNCLKRRTRVPEKENQNKKKWHQDHQYKKSKRSQKASKNKRESRDQRRENRGSSKQEE